MLELQVVVVVDEILEVGLEKVFLEEQLVPLHKVLSREHKVHVGRLPLLQGMEGGCGENPRLSLT